ncbi:MAG: SCO family protein [Deltaproteobacteria bacterium]|nr:SCO family protein [Deltaproteobacteria bacterium]
MNEQVNDVTNGTVEQDKKPFYKNPFLIAFVLGALALTLMRPISLMFLRAPPPLIETQPWSLTGDDGKSFGSEELQGKVWLASFVFTRCPTACPKITATMKEAEEKMTHHGEDMHFVSFTVDPSYDTPEIFQAYKKKMNIDTPRWTFVGGTEKDIHALLQGQLKLFVGEKTLLSDDEKSKPERDQLFDIAHSGRLALFDQVGALRGLFTADDAGLAAMGNAARLLVAKGPNP